MDPTRETLRLFSSQREKSWNLHTSEITFQKRRGGSSAPLCGSSWNPYIMFLHMFWDNTCFAILKSVYPLFKAVHY